MNTYFTYMVTNVDDSPKSITTPITIIRKKNPNLLIIDDVFGL